jgi:hypothetical protein
MTDADRNLVRHRGIAGNQSDYRDRQGRGERQPRACPHQGGIAPAAGAARQCQHPGAAQQRSLHAVLVESLTNTRTLLARLEVGITVPRDQQREVMRLLYFAPRHQVQALAACLQLEGLE